MDPSRRIFAAMYGRAKGPEDLPWFHDQPTAFLPAIAAGRPGRALDIGCGTGTDTIFLAAKGWEVTGLDFTPAALAMARGRAAAAGATPQFREGDVLSAELPGAFDLVVDAGCFHNVPGAGSRDRYRERLLGWLAASGDYVLVHFEKRHLLDWRPIGPRRWRRTMVEEFFAPELGLVDYSAETMRTAFPIGPVIRVASYRFRRRGA